MKKPFVLIAAIVAVVGFCAVVAMAKERMEVETSLNLKYNANDPSDPYGAGGSFSGRVNARKGCQNGRKVTLTHGVNKFGSDRSNNRGKYKIIGPLPGDGLRAVARERTITKNNGDKIVCKSGRSNKVRPPR